MSYTPAVRRKRRRRILMVLAVVGALLGVAYGITKAQGETQTTREYLDVAFEVATGDADVAEELLDLIVNVEDFNRSALLERLDSLEADVGDMVDRLEDADPPGDLVEANLFLRIAATTWRSGMSDASAGLLALSSNPLDEEGLATLTRGFTDLRVGDRAYTGFLSALGDVDTTLQGGPIPTVQFVPSEQETMFDSRELARRMFIAGSVIPVLDVAVADLSLEPGAVGEREGLPVLAVTADQAAEVRISNRGNTDAIEVPVRLSLVSNAGELYAAAQEIAELPAGGVVSLTFSQLPVEPGNIYEIEVEVTLDDDRADNDSIAFLFLVNTDG